MAQLAGNARLPRVWPGRVVVGRERDVRAEQSLDAHRTDDAGRPYQSFRTEQCQDADGGHLLRAVEKCEAFLGLELQRFEAAQAERVRAADEVAANLRPAPADQRQREMRQGCEIARSAHGPLLGDT